MCIMLYIEQYINVQHYTHASVINVHMQVSFVVLHVVFMAFPAHQKT